MNKIYIYPLALLSFSNSMESLASDDERENVSLLANERSQIWHDNTSTDVSIQRLKAGNVSPILSENNNFTGDKRGQSIRNRKYPRIFGKQSQTRDESFEKETSKSYQNLKNQELNSLNVEPRFNRAISKQTDISITRVGDELANEELRKLLKNKPNVEILNLMNNCITNAGLNYIVKCNNIKFLNLCGNEGIDYKGVMYILSAIDKKPIIQSLTTLQLSKTYFTDEQRDRLNRQCQVVSNKLRINFN